MQEKLKLKLQTEANKQRELLEKFQSEGKTLIPSKTNNHWLPMVGTVQEVEVEVRGFTPKGLAVLYIKGEEDDRAFHLVKPKSILKYNSRKLQPNVDDNLNIKVKFVIGVRAVGSEHFVVSLRLPF